MADSKTTALTELTTFDGDEEFYVVDDDDGTPVSKRVTIENLTTEVTDGIADAIANGDASTLTSANAHSDAKVTQTITNGTTTTAPSEDAVFDALALKAPLASPTFTGTPAAPTASQGTNTTQVATTAYVQTEAGLLVPKSLFDANTMLYATTDNTPAALTIAASRIVGRKSSGDITALTGAEAGDIIGVYAAYTPTISQNGARTTSSMTARYCQIGKMVHAYGMATISNAGTSGQPITVSLPVAPSTAVSQVNVGVGYYTRSGAIYKDLTANMVTPATAYIRFFNDTGVIGEDVPFATANTDTISWGITYEAA